MARQAAPQILSPLDITAPATLELPDLKQLPGYHQLRAIEMSYRRFVEPIFHHKCFLCHTPQSSPSAWSR